MRICTTRLSVRKCNGMTGKTLVTQSISQLIIWYADSRSSCDLFVNDCRKAGCCLVPVELGPKSTTEDVEGVGDQDHSEAEEGKQPGSPLQTESVVHLRDEQREGSTTT